MQKQSDALSPSQQKRRSTGAVSKSSLKAERENQQLLLEQQQRERQVRIVASTFANMELMMTQQTYEATAKQLTDATTECERLKAEMEARDRDALEVADFLRKDATTKAAKLRDLEIQLATAETKKMQDENTIRRNYEAIIKSKDAAIQSAEQQIDRLSREVDAAAKYQIEKSDLLLELEEARNKQKSIVEHYEQELNRIKFASVEERVRLQAVETEMSKTFKQEVETRSTAIAKLKNAQVHGLNAQLSKDRQILEQEVADLVVLANGYRSQIEELKRDHCITKELHSSALKETVSLKLKVHDAENRKRLADVDKLETIASERRKDEESQTYLKSQISLLEKELAESLKQQKAQAYELQRVRTLSQSIIDQRSGLEQFFYAALDELHQKRQLRHAVEGDTDIRTFLTGIPAPSGGSTSSALALSSPRHSAAVGNRLPTKLESLLKNEPNAARVRLLTGDRSARREVVGEAEGAGIGGSSRSSRRAHSARGIAAERSIDPDAYYHNCASDARILSAALQRGRVGPSQTASPTLLADGVVVSRKPKATETLLPTPEQYSQLPWQAKEEVVKGMLRYINAFMGPKGRSQGPVGIAQGEGLADPSIETIAKDIMADNADPPPLADVDISFAMDGERSNNIHRPATTKALRTIQQHAFAPRPPSNLLSSRPPTRALPLQVAAVPPLPSPRK